MSLISERNDIFNVLNNWHNQIKLDIGVIDIFMFGSLVLRDGHLFDKANSDIDLICVMPDNLTNAVERTKWLIKLKEHKQLLELELSKLLQRKVVKPIVSIIPITQNEIFCDVHKSGVRDFFRENEFYDLNAQKVQYGLLEASEFVEIDDTIRQLFEFTQRLRNKYLTISYIPDSNLLDWASETEFAPKELLRSSALAAYIEKKPSKKVEKTDITVGMSHLLQYVYSRRHEDELYEKINDWLSKRSVGKGYRQNLESRDYLFISEIIFDMALSLTPVDTSMPTSLFKKSKSTGAALELTKSINCQFIVGKNGLIKGKDTDIYPEITNATVNLSWRTEPYFDIILEEVYQLEIKIKKSPKDGKSINRLRKLLLLHKELVTGFKYIIYYQYNFFGKSQDTISDVLTALRRYTLTLYANYFISNRYKGAEEGFLEAYIPDYNHFREKYPKANLIPVLNFGIPNNSLNSYLRLNKELNEKFSRVDFMCLSICHQPIRSLNSKLLANFFVPLLVKKLTENDMDPMSSDIQIQKINLEITDLRFWYFGIK